jgi:hypothetical protein
MALLKSLPTEGIEQLARASTVASTGLAEMQKAGAENAETLEHQAAVLKQNYNAALTELGVHIVPLAVQELQGLNGILALLDGTLDKIRSGSSIATVLTLGNRELKEGSDAAERLQDALRQLADQARSGDLNLTGLTGAQLESLSKTVDKFTTPGTAGFLAPLRAAIDAQGSRGVGPAALPVITVVADPAAIKAREEFAKETERVLKSISESLKGAAVTALDDFLAEYRKIADSLTQEQRQAAEQAIAGLRAKVLEEQAKNPELITRPAPVAIRAEGLDRLDQTLSDEEKHQKAIADAAEREARARAEALQHAATLGRQIEQVARGAIGLAQAFGLADSASSAVLQNVVSLAGALPEAIKGLEALNKGGADLQAIGGIAGALAPVVGVIGGIAGLIAGLTAEDPNVALLRQTNEKLRLAVDNLAKHFDSFAINLTGNQQIKAQGAVTELLSGKRLPGDTSFHGLGSFLSGGSANGINLTDLQQVAKEVLGQALDTSNIERFTAGLKALQDALALADRTRFADSFTGQLEALNARFQLLNITDPVEKLKELLAVIADVPRTVTIALPNGKTETRQIGHGSPAIANALAGLDLGNAGDRAKALDKLTALLDQLTSGQLDAKARGDLTPDQFKQELLDLGGLLRDANQQVGGQSQSFAIDRTITEITGSRIAALLDTSLVYQSTLPEIRDLLAAAFGGGLITAPILPASQTVAGPSIIIQAGAFPLTVVVPPGADGQAIGQAAAAAQAQALDELLAQRARLKQTAAGGVVQ